MLTVQTTPTPDPRRWRALAVLCLSLLVIGIDNTILNVAIPTLERDLGASASQLQWIVDSYMLVFAGLLLTAGALGDRFGRKRALTAGLVVFGAGSALSALAGTPGTLIASRALMGLGGALIMPSTLSILTATFPPSERPKAIAIWTACSGLGVAVGPITGGWLLEHYDWNAVFLVNLPVVALALAAGRPLLRESRDPSAPRLDPGGFALSIAGLTALLWAIIEAPSRGWTDGLVLGGFGVAAAVLAAFVAWELRVDEPMLDVRLFRVPRFAAASGAISLAFFALFGMIFFLTQYLQAVLGYTALEAGVRTLPVAGAIVVAGGLSARLAERHGTTRLVAGGLAVASAGLLVLTQAGPEAGIGAVLASETILGLGIGLAMAPATESIMGSLPLAKASVGSAVNDTTRTAGGALGVAILGSVLSSGYRGDMQAQLSGLPDPAAAAAGDSVQGALAVAERLGTGGDQLAEVARVAFVSGMHSAVIIAAAVMLAGALLALRFLPARASAPVPAPVPADQVTPLSRAPSGSPRERRRDHGDASARPAPLGRGGRGHRPGHPADPRPGRLPRTLDGARAHAGGGGQGDDLPALPFQGGAGQGRDPAPPPGPDGTRGHGFVPRRSRDAAVNGDRRDARRGRTAVPPPRARRGRRGARAPRDLPRDARQSPPRRAPDRHRAGHRPWRAAGGDRSRGRRRPAHGALPLPAPHRRG
jgi:EmrB/QacA subfamily drug resistance transporter